VNVDQFVEFPIAGKMLICGDQSLFIEVFWLLLGSRISSCKTLFVAERHTSVSESV
jgi:hypothetical protein